MVNEDLFLYRCKCDACDEELHMRSALKMMSPEQTMSKNKMFFPNAYWWYTFDVMHTCAKKNEWKNNEKNQWQRKKIIMADIVN